MREDFELNGRKCHTYAVGDGGPAVFWAAMNAAEADAMVSLIEKAEDGMESFTLFAFEAGDWFDSLSPKEFDTGLGQRFGNGGKATQEWLVDEAIPYVEENFPRTSEFAIIGYSLAGLFALWTFYSTGAFKGAGCCSGSLWFDGWDSYADGAKSPDNGVVYMSLGGKEPGSGNILTASIGTQYHKQKKRLEKDPRLRAFTFVTNSGGHFSDPVGRLFKAVEWIVGELSVY